MIKDLKELQALLKLCRKQGITEITLDGTVIKFGPMPAKSSETDSDEDPHPAEISDKDLLEWALGPGGGN